MHLRHSAEQVLQTWTEQVLQTLFLPEPVEPQRAQPVTVSLCAPHRVQSAVKFTPQISQSRMEQVLQQSARHVSLSSPIVASQTPSPQATLVTRTGLYLFVVLRSPSSPL